jgi:nitrate/nitrite-specific signal transduction histidine kinase
LTRHKAIMRKLPAFLLAAILVSFAGLALAQTGRAATSVNLAGEQRMLSQRIVNMYIQTGLDVMPELAKRQLSLATQRFEGNLAALKPLMAGSAETARAYERLGGEWPGMKNAVSVAVSRDAAVALSLQAETTLTAAEELTRMLADENKSDASRLVNLAGRQRMLSQRIAKSYLLRSWGVDSSAVRQELESATKDFSAGLAKLRANEGNSADIRGELDEVAQQWEWLQASMSVDGAGYYRLIVAESSDAILQATDRITRLYEAQSRR